MRPLRDLIVAIPLEDDIKKVGALFIPENYQQDLRVHYKALVLFSGPKAMEHCPPGTVVWVSESWGDKWLHKGRKVRIGRIRDINAVLEGEVVPDHNKYES